MVNKSVVTRADGVRAVVDSAHAPAGAEAVNFVLVSENGHVVTHSAWGTPIAHWRGRRGRARGTGHPCTNSCQPRGVPTRANPAPRWDGFTTHSCIPNVCTGHGHAFGVHLIIGSTASVTRSRAPPPPPQSLGPEPQPLEWMVAPWLVRPRQQQLAARLWLRRLPRGTLSPAPSPNPPRAAVRDGSLSSLTQVG